jgi:hypothetical protein
LTAAAAAALALLPLAAASSGCESTRAAAKRYTAEGSKAFAARGLSVGVSNRAVQVLERAVVHDANGTAAVVVVRNRGGQTLADVPIAIAVKDAHGRVLWRNDAPGLEPGLTHAALLVPGQTIAWVNDQVLLDGSVSPAALAAKVGAGSPAPATATRLAIDVQDATLQGDPASGLVEVGRVVNRSGVPQRDLVVAVVARRGGKIVAAGRGLVQELAANARARFQAFFVGDPRGAQLSFDTQPSTLGGAR